MSLHTFDSTHYFAPSGMPPSASASSLSMLHVDPAPISSAASATFSFKLNVSKTSNKSADFNFSNSRGGYNYDQQHGYVLKWQSQKAFETWFRQEQQSKSIELRQHEHLVDYGKTWSTRTSYVCSRGGTGGRKAYNKKNPESERKVVMKFSDVIIEYLLGLGVDPKNVLDQVRDKDQYTESGLEDLRSQAVPLRTRYVTRADIRRVQKKIEAKKIRFAKQDGASVRCAVEKLREEGHFVVLKMTTDAVPEGSDVDPRAFILIIHTKYQIECWRKWGSDFAGLAVCHTMRIWNPLVVPRCFMSDRDLAQLGSILRAYWDSLMILLCWWHVLHAWQQRFVTTSHPELWELLKKWIRVTDPVEFQSYWEKIQMIAPPSMTEYLRKYWMGGEDDDWTTSPKLWSAVYRTKRGIFQLGDTNMLVEAWHHLLKGDFLEGKRNRRLDHLVYTLTNTSISHFIARHDRQHIGFEGPDALVLARNRADKKALAISTDDIIPGNGDEPTTFAVCSQSRPDVSYLVDINAYDCNCPEFAKIKYCKHMRAVQIKFPESRITYPISAVETHIMSPSKELESLDIVIPELPIQRDSSAIKQQLRNLLLTLDANPSLTLPDSLFELSSQVQSVQQDLRDAGLPPRKLVAPNQHTVTETAETMGIQVKSKRPRQHLDPYSGNERPGKKAKEDAREPLDNIRYVINATSFAASKSSEESGVVDGGLHGEVGDLMAEAATGITDVLSVAISQLQTISKQDGRPRSSDAPISRLTCATGSITIGHHLSVAAVALASTTFLVCARNTTGRLVINIRASRSELCRLALFRALLDNMLISNVPWHCKLLIRLRLTSVRLSSSAEFAKKIGARGHSSAQKYLVDGSTVPHLKVYGS
ncbi:hypothetical protein C8J56DRAFT_1057841 [Mycena floridula]|nr:hypothetical protein C8J56DRAFT_1057841 [Mycena floridula]